MTSQMRCRKGLQLPVSIALVLVLSAASANAHLVNTGLGPFYDGVSHFVLSPEDLIPVFAIALLAGLNGPAAGRSALFVLAATWLVAGVVGSLIGRPLLPAAVATGSFLLLGTLIAIDRKLSPAMIAVLALAIGVLHGWINGAGGSGAKPATIGLLFGATSAIFVLVAIIAAAPVATRAGWARIGFRVAGSWIVAIGLLMLGWEMRKI